MPSDVSTVGSDQGKVLPAGRASWLSALVASIEKPLMVVGFCAIWQLSAWLGLINTIILPPPTVVLAAFADLIVSGALILDILTSLKRVLIGFAVASIVGLVLGLACARVPILYRMAQPLIESLRPISPIAWIPMAVLWFGLGDTSAAFLIFLGVFFPMYTNTFLGFSSVDIQYVRASQVLGFSRFQFFTDVLIRFALPYIFAGMRIGLGFGWMCVVAAEMLGANSGLGYMIQLNRVIFEVPNIIVGMITIGLIGYAINEIMQWLETKLLPWVQRE